MSSADIASFNEPAELRSRLADVSGLTDKLGASEIDRWSRVCDDTIITCTEASRDDPSSAPDLKAVAKDAKIRKSYLTHVSTRLKKDISLEMASLEAAFQIQYTKAHEALMFNVLDRAALTSAIENFKTIVSICTNLEIRAKRLPDQRIYWDFYNYGKSFNGDLNRLQEMLVEL